MYGVENKCSEYYCITSFPSYKRTQHVLQKAMQHYFLDKKIYRHGLGMFRRVPLYWHLVFKLLVNHLLVSIGLLYDATGVGEGDDY